MKLERRSICALEPQPVSAETSTVFIGDTHWTCLDSLVRSQLEHSRVTLLTGEPGVGKTTILSAATARLMQHPFLFVWPTPNDLVEIWRRQADAEQGDDRFGIDLAGLIDQGGNQSLRRHRQVCLVLDSIETLGEDLLQILLHLVDCFADAVRAPTLLLVGRAEVWETLKAPLLSPLRQYIVNPQFLHPLSDAGSAQYLNYALAALGLCAEDVFSPRGLRAVVRAGQGNPRRINALALTTLKLASQRGGVITERIVAQADSPVSNIRRPAGRPWSNLLRRAGIFRGPSSGPGRPAAAEEEKLLASERSA